MTDYLITDIKGKIRSNYGEGYKPAPKMVNKTTETDYELLEVLIKNRALKDMIINQQIDRAMSKEMQMLTASLEEYIEKHKVKTEID